MVPLSPFVCHLTVCLLVHFSSLPFPSFFDFLAFFFPDHELVSLSFSCIRQQGRSGVLTRRAAAQLAAENSKDQESDSWGGRPKAGLRPRDTNVPVVGTKKSITASEGAAATRRASSSRRMSEAVPDIDETDRKDPLSAADFINHMFEFYKKAEAETRVAPDYMSRQSDINDKMRAILIDWLVDVHLKFKLMPETLYLTVHLIDRFLEVKQVTRRHLQLVGVTAMLIASKYEEIWAPEVRDFVYISDRAYNRDQILNMEKIMLNALRFKLTVPTQYHFTARFLKACGLANKKEAIAYATYLVELALPDYGMLRFPYSLIAAAAASAAAGVFGMDPFPRALLHHSTYSPADINRCIRALEQLFQRAPNSSLTAVHKKFSSEKFHRVAAMQPPSERETPMDD